MRIGWTQEVFQQRYLLVATTPVHAQSDNSCFGFSICHVWNMRSTVAIWILESATRLGGNLVSMSNDAFNATTDCAVESSTSLLTKHHPLEWEDATTPSIRGSGTASHANRGGEGTTDAVRNES